MSQLDVSISFNHFFSLLLCFYFFIHFSVYILIKFWYSQSLRSFDIVKSSKLEEDFDNVSYLKKILKN